MAHDDRTDPLQSRSPEAPMMVLDDLDQLRALSDPLRLRILEALAGRPRTTKQVAELLEEKPTRLYHHVDALESAGLVRLVHTRPKRGTLEKYYQAAARRFRADSSLFPTAPEDDETSWPVLGARIFEGVAEDLRRFDPSEDEPSPTVIAHVKVRGQRGTLAEVFRRVEELLQDVQDLDDSEDEVEEEAFDLAIALYPRPPGGRDR